MTVNRFLDGIPVIPILYPPGNGNWEQRRLEMADSLISQVIDKPPMHVNFTSIHVPNLAKPGGRFILSEKPGSSM
jgi:hypothetical protein